MISNCPGEYSDISVSAGRPCAAAAAIHVVEHRREIVEPLQAVGVYLLPLAARGRRPRARAGRPPLPSVDRTRARRRRRASGPARAKRSTHAHQRVARIRGGRRALAVEHGEHELAGGRRRATARAPACRAMGRAVMSASPVSQTRPVSSTSSPVMSSPRIEPATCRPGVEDALQLFAPHRLAAQHAGRIGDHDLHGLDVGMRREEGGELGARPAMLQSPVMHGSRLRAGSRADA